MKLTNLGSNKTLITMDNQEYFFSYSTCVAGFCPDNGYWKVDKFYSVTTSKHVNSYLNGNEPTLVETVDVDIALSCI